MDRPEWPSNLAKDYAGAVVRLVSIMQRRRQYLLFGLVELHPHEIPLPPKLDPVSFALNGATLVSTIVTMPVSDALAWYESGLADTLTVPGRPSPTSVITPRLGAEPALGLFVVGNEVPFALTWHCSPRIHHLVPMDEPPEEVEWLFTPENPARSKAREWIQDQVGFDLLAFDEFCMSLVLLAPNPIARSFNSHLKLNLTSAPETIGVEVEARRGFPPSDMKIRFREFRPEGISTVIDCQLDELGRAIIPLPQQAWRSELELVSEEHGILGVTPPGFYLRGGISVVSEVIEPATHFEVPSRGKRDPGISVPVLNRQKLAHGKQQAAVYGAAPDRLVQLASRRDKRPYLERPDGAAQGEDINEHLFIGRVGEDASFVRRLLARAQERVIFVDFYFNISDVIEFAIATQYPSVITGILRGRDNSDPSLFEGLKQLDEKMEKLGRRAPDVRVMGGRASNYHDRFLLIDDDVWHFGHSFNQLRLGKDISLASRLRHPDELRKLILADFEHAQTFAEYWNDAQST